MKISPNAFFEAKINKTQSYFQRNMVIKAQLWQFCNPCSEAAPQMLVLFRAF